MEKLVYLLWDEPGLDPAENRKRLLDRVAPRLLDAGVETLTLQLDDPDAQVPPPVPVPEGEPLLAAVVSIGLACSDRREPHEAVLRSAAPRVAGYLVSGALYTDYGDNEFAEARSWPDGSRSPGITVVTLLERPARMDRAAWIAHWHGVQSPESAALQPRCRYVRNEVVRAITPDAPAIEGIVEECWPSARHVTDPMLFYRAEGSRDQLSENIQRMMKSVTAFLDLDRIRCFTMSEYLIKS